MHARLAALALALSLAAALPAQRPAPATPAFAMEDQFERRHDVKQYRGSVLVLIYGDRASANANRALGEQVHTAFHPTARGLPPARARLAPVTPVPGAAASPDVVAVPVACVGKVPNLVKRVIRGQIKGGAPDVPVWLDFDDTMKTLFGLKPGVPNVVVLDTQGRYRYNVSGAPTPQTTQQLVNAIEGLRREAAAPPKK